MEFKDFSDNPQELVGKTVLYESGFTYSEKRDRYLVKIEKVTKTGFKITSFPYYLFSLTEGYRKGLNRRADIGTISRCTLVTDEEADQLREEWMRKREINSLRKKMADKLATMTYDQLIKMEQL